MPPITDPRPFAAVLADWLARHNLTFYAAAPILGAVETTVSRWHKGHNCRHEKAYRALMTLVDEGRV
ncbi:hypothetical protein [Paracoccus sp. (in: a-proteobacteria)]|uniref:hypothetical protein n=1 Tax=Paracoccus sp. TaxID=267 RepID=UPI0026DFFC1D|nr:hypothetical protein [Paracoccus sp. (in: a-proteobacteria)]MDO5648832.1 hypothetical protein [Paracoccus sp. (in: a-proteobacteria)]